MSVSSLLKKLSDISSGDAYGVVSGISGLVIECVGLLLPVGCACWVDVCGKFVDAEVIGFKEGKLQVMALAEIHGIQQGARIMAKLTESGSHGVRLVPAGSAMLGRIVDSVGNPLDGKGPLNEPNTTPLYRDAPNPMHRVPVRQKMDVGVKSINALLTVGRGQRLGLFAGSGVGKSVLLGMMARFTDADVVVVGLIGERGREVREFVEDALGEEGLAKSVVVAAPADSVPLSRMHGAAYATAIAEHFRDEGKHVLLIMDSLTRYAMAQREIAIAAGEPPATKGYAPSVFAKLPQLVERSGNGIDGGGSITAFFTVLSEGDDQQDPVADCARAVLDGHFVLSRRLAEAGHFPAIDISASASRVMSSVVSKSHQEAALKFRALWSKFQEGKDLLAVGAYRRGGDHELDMAIDKYPAMQTFLRQNMHDSFDIDTSLGHMMGVTG